MRFQAASELYCIAVKPVHFPSPWHRPAAAFLVLAIGCGCVAAEPVDERRLAAVNEAVAAMSIEAREIGEYMLSEHPPVWHRPHGAIRNLGPRDAMVVLERMLRPMTGNDYADTYIRWHLMHVVNRASAADRRETGERLVRLIQMMPGPIEVEILPEARDEPPEIGAEYRMLINRNTVVVGYPPYQRTIWPPQSHRFMVGERLAAAEADYARAMELKDKFVVIPDPIAIARNRRVRMRNWVVRQYRGELVYALIQTGDPEMLRLVFAEVDRQAKLGNGVALDLLTFVYLAAFDGALNRYDAALLIEVSQMLDKTARAHDRYQRYAGQSRNFGDYAFHLIEMLRDGGGFIQPAEQPLARDMNAAR